MNKFSLNKRLPICFFSCCFMLLLTHPTWGKTTPKSLSMEDKQAINSVEQYLNDLKTLESRFLQASSSGSYAEGVFYLSRPGKMRIEYDPPVKFLIVSDGTWLIYHDKEIDQITHLPLGMSPVGLILEEKISLFSNDIHITKIQRGPGILSITIVRENDDIGELTLIFSEKPLELRKWIVKDAQGVTTSISLLSTKHDIHLAPKLFNIKLRPAKIREPES